MLILKNQQALTLAYFRDFKCVGGACIDNCCKDWRVDIDKNTYLSYRTGFKKNKPLQAKADTFVKRNKKAASDFSYATIVMDQQRNCPFLSSETGLCEIQLDSGYGMLSDVCKTYPRTASIVDGKYELAMTASCAEVLRKILFEKESVQLKRQTISCDTSMGFSHDTTIDDLKTDVMAHFWSIRAFSFEILQHADYSFEQKLTLLGIAYNKLSTMQKDEDLSGAPAYLNQLLVTINAGKLDISSLSLEDKSIKFRITESLLEGILTDRGINTPVLSVALIKAVRGLINKGEPTENRDYAAIVSNYEKALETYYDPWAKEKGYMVDNFFFNEFFRQIQPFNAEKDIWKSYTQLCATFSIFKYIFAGVALRENGMSDDDVLHVFLGIAKGFQHANELFRVFTSKLDTLEMNTLPHMVLLIS